MPIGGRDWRIGLSFDERIGGLIIGRSKARVLPAPSPRPRTVDDARHKPIARVSRHGAGSFGPVSSGAPTGIEKLRLTDETITHTQALNLIDEHLGDHVYFGFLVARRDDSGELAPVDQVIAVLTNPMDPAPPRLESDFGFYEVGSHSFGLEPMAGTVHLRDNGIDFRVADTVLIRIAWRGSREMGDWRPTREALAKFNELCWQGAGR